MKYPDAMPAIPIVTDLDRAFPVASKLPPLPKYVELPEEFREEVAPACKAASHLFYSGSKGIDERFAFKARYDAFAAEDFSAVIRLVGAHLGCFDHKHEHKIAGCGALLDRWLIVSERP